MNNQTPHTIPDEIRKYLESLLSDANISTLDDETKEEMIKELYLRLDEHLTIAIVDNLPEEYMEEFMKMNEEGKPMAEIQMFLVTKMPNYNEVFSEAFDSFKQMYLGNVVVKRNQEQILNQKTEN